TLRSASARTTTPWRRLTSNCRSYVPDIVMWQNATIAALYSRSLHVSGNITRLSGRDDLPFSLGDCHAGEVLHPTHDPRSHPQVLDRFRRRAIRQLNGRASLYGSQRFSPDSPRGELRRVCEGSRRQRDQRPYPITSSRSCKRGFISELEDDARPRDVSS